MTFGAELPLAVQPDLTSSALVLIDVQNDFLDDGPFPIAGTRAAMPAMARLLDAYRSAERPIIHVIRLYEGDDVDLLRRELIARGASLGRPETNGALVPTELLDAKQAEYHRSLHAGAVVQLLPREFMIFKPRWSAFFRTRLDGHLRALGVDTLVVAGCNFPNCPRATIYDATAHDYRVLVATDAISGITSLHLAELPKVGAATASTDEIVAAMHDLAHHS